MESPFGIGNSDAQIRRACGVIIPQDRSAEVIKAALAKVRNERRVLDEIS